MYTRAASAQYYHRGLCDMSVDGFVLVVLNCYLSSHCVTLHPSPVPQETGKM